MSTAILSGRLLRDGERVFYDMAYDLAGTVMRKTPTQIEVRWDGGNAVWYPLHQMFYQKREG